jgi:MFS family permease
MEAYNELDIINQIRGKAMHKPNVTGRNPFLVWGYSIVVAYFLTFAAMMLWDNPWCLFILCLIPVVGVPFMQTSLHKDYQRHHLRTKEDDYVLKVWLFVGVAIGFFTIITSIAGFYRQSLFSLASLLVSMGSLFTGVILRYKPKKMCGLIACVLSAVPLFLQDELWRWQLLATAIIVLIALVIPGHMYNSYLRNKNLFES